MNYKDLENAVLFKNIEQIRQAREEGLDVNKLTNFGNSLLHTAINDGKEEDIILVLKELIDFPNLDIDKRNVSFSMSPLMISLHNKKYLVADFLIQSGANINIENKVGNTPLMHAIDNQDEFQAKFLLNYPVELEHINKNGATAVLLAASNNIALKELMEKGANIMHQSPNKNSIAYSLSLNPHKDTTIFIAKEIDKLNKSKEFFSYIDDIVEMYKEECVSFPQKDNSQSISNIFYVKNIVNSILLHHKLNQETSDKITIKRHKI